MVTLTLLAFLSKGQMTGLHEQPNDLPSGIWLFEILSNVPLARDK